MNVEFIIVGQGIAGTWLSYYLQKEKKSFLLFDEFKANSSSRNAAGVINPVTGRRLVSAWMVDELHPYAYDAYTEIGNLLGIQAISHRDVIDFFPNPFMKENFEKRITEKYEYLSASTHCDEFTSYFNFEFGCGSINPAYTAHLDVLLPAWRQHLHSKQQLIEEPINPSEVEIVPGGVRYKNINAQYIIFCDGAQGYHNPFFSRLPFSPNKGEAILVEIKGKDMPSANIFKKSIMLVPMTTPGIFWVGASNTWEFENDFPTVKFKDETEHVLRKWLKVPYTFHSHIASLRPATMERRPFVGLHPRHERIGILNGMGTKGCSLAPFFAHQLTDHLLQKKIIDPYADVKRHSRLLLQSGIEP